MTRRRIFPVLALLLALLMGAGAFTPSPWLWKCHHSSRVVAAPFATPGAMPCRMGGPMAGGMMACCLAHRPVQVHGTRSRQALSAPDCNPIFVQLAVPPAVLMAQAPNGACDNLTAACALLAPLGGVMPPRITLAMRQRPPPAADIPASDLLHVPGLRAPPSA